MYENIKFQQGVTSYLQLIIRQAELILDGQNFGNHCSQSLKMATKLPSPSY